MGTGRRPGVAVAVRTSAAIAALLLSLGAHRAHADEPNGQRPPAPAPPLSDAEILGTEPGWRIESADLRLGYVWQDGRGYQSQAGPEAGPGSEHAWVLEPWGRFVIRQNRRIRHQVVVPVDIVTAASPDAVDAMTSASLRNAAAEVDVRTTIERSPVTMLSTRVAFHVEEPLTSGTVGAGWRRGLADDNAAIALETALTVDGFDKRNQYGGYLGKSARGTSTSAVSFSQLLSTTTAFDASYTFTAQYGVLAQTWNAVPVEGEGPEVERFPRHRLRHAVTARLSQRVPITASTLKARYRFYVDDFGIVAHTVDASAYQYLTRWLLLRVGGRLHRQSAADFFTTSLDESLDASPIPRTADSDLAAFDARELSVELSVLRGRRNPILRDWAMSAELMAYERSNDFRLTAVALSVGRNL